MSETVQPLPDNENNPAALLLPIPAEELVPTALVEQWAQAWAEQFRSGIEREEKSVRTDVRLLAPAIF